MSWGLEELVIVGSIKLQIVELAASFGVCCFRVPINRCIEHERRKEHAYMSEQRRDDLMEEEGHEATRQRIPELEAEGKVRQAGVKSADAISERADHVTPKSSATAKPKRAQKLRERLYKQIDDFIDNTKFHAGSVIDLSIKHTSKTTKPTAHKKGNHKKSRKAAAKKSKKPTPKRSSRRVK